MESASAWLTTFLFLSDWLQEYTETMINKVVTTSSGKVLPGLSGFSISWLKV